MLARNAAVRRSQAARRARTFMLMDWFTDVPVAPGREWPGWLKLRQRAQARRIGRADVLIGTGSDVKLGDAIFGHQAAVENLALARIGNDEASAGRCPFNTDRRPRGCCACAAGHGAALGEA
jgi:hypothetical protein